MIAHTLWGGKVLHCALMLLQACMHACSNISASSGTSMLARSNKANVPAGHFTLVY